MEGCGSSVKDSKTGPTLKEALKGKNQDGVQSEIFEISNIFRMLPWYILR